MILSRCYYKSSINFIDKILICPELSVNVLQIFALNNYVLWIFDVKDYVLQKSALKKYFFTEFCFIEVCKIKVNVKEV